MSLTSFNNCLFKSEFKKKFTEHKVSGRHVIWYTRGENAITSLPQGDPGTLKRMTTLCELQVLNSDPKPPPHRPEPLQKRLDLQIQGQAGPHGSVLTNPRGAGDFRSQKSRADSSSITESAQICILTCLIADPAAQ